MASRSDANDEPVNPRDLGRRIQIRVDLDKVGVTCEATDGPPRCRAMVLDIDGLEPTAVRTVP